MYPKTEQHFEHSPSSTIDIAVYSDRLSTFALQSSVPGTNHSYRNQHKDTLLYFGTEKREQKFRNPFSITQWTQTHSVGWFRHVGEGNRLTTK